MTKMKKVKIKNFRKRQKLWIFKLGKEKMELATIKGYSSLKEDMLSFERLLLRRDGFKTRMYGHHIMTLNGLQESVI